MRAFLRTGFQWDIAFQLLRPWNLFQCAVGLTKTRLAETLAVITGKEPAFKRGFSRIDLFRLVLERRMFTGLTMASPRRNAVEIVISARELRRGTAFRFGNGLSGDWRRGRLVEGGVDVALAVAASTAYPIFLPALDRTWKFHKGGVETAPLRKKRSTGAVSGAAGGQAAPGTAPPPHPRSHRQRQ